MTDQEAHAQAFENGRKKGDAEGYARGKAEAVKHGRKVTRIVDHECPSHTVQECSLCYTRVEGWHIYCPLCGAKLDGDG